jgi:hypothetical protein
MTRCVGRAAAAALISLGVGTASPAIVYVDHAATGANNGTSWTDAYLTLQSAIINANDGDEIWIAEGRYTPPASGWTPIYDTIDIHGGFVSGATSLDDRDPLVNRTILDADINQDDGPDHTNKSDNAPGILQMGAFFDVLGDVAISGLVFQNSGSRSALIIEAASLDVDTCLFTNNLDLAESPDPPARGAAMRVNAEQLRIVDSVFTNNRIEVNQDTGGGSRGFGGAVYFSGDLPGDRLVLRRCEFRDNTIESVTGAVGGALASYADDNEIIACEFTGNSAYATGSDAAGGAAALLTGDTLVMRNCLFESNTASAIIDIEGGGLNTNASNVEVVATDFIANRAVDLGTEGNTVGAGAWINSGTAQVRSCRFLGNACDRAIGGGLWLSTSSQSPAGSGLVANSFFSGNSAGRGGGLGAFANLRVVSSTFVGNAATGIPAVARGGAVYADILSDSYEEPPLIENTIMWGNTSTGGMAYASQYFSAYDTSEINNSIIEGWDGPFGGSGGFGNSGADPLLIDPDGDDGIPGTTDDSAAIRMQSPAIDRGDNAYLPADDADEDNDADLLEPMPFDIAGQPRLHDDIDIDGPNGELGPQVDIGAFEYQGRSCPADLDTNGLLDLTDVTLFVTAFPAQDPAADLDGDGLWDLTDVNIFVSVFLDGCP